MIFCTKCGNQLEDNSKFCPNYGLKTEAFNEISVDDKRVVAAQKKKVRIIAAIGLVVCLLFLILLFTGEDSSNNITDSSNNVTTEVTLISIEEWYQNQMPAVSQCLIDYAEAVDGLSSMNVVDCEFYFGEDEFGFYNCHYSMYFTCKVDGNDCTGEARGFLEYEGDTVNWFHFEIFRDSDLATLVEYYDDSYEQIEEDYLKELDSLYN